MLNKWVRNFDQYFISGYLLKWFLYILPLSFVVGSIVAFFLELLDLATLTRWNNEWLLYFLPFIGVAIVALYKWKGKNTEAGNNLVMDEIHKPGAGIPFRMAPLVLFSTVLTHLFGGSAGREGTAVQIGGSIAHFMAKKMNLKKADCPILLMAGVAAGFAAVFGTPVAGAIFALEVLAIGRIHYEALLPCFFAAILANVFCTFYGIQHTHYAIHFHELANAGFLGFSSNFGMLAWILLAGVLFGLTSLLFSKLSHFFKAWTQSFFKSSYLIPIFGAGLLILLTFLLGTTDYLGLGVNTQSGFGNSIVNAFKPGGVDPFSWFWKIIFTVITLSTGFKGGEVTPLFFIGAALGNILAVLMGMPVDLFAALGFLAVFAGATNTPLACTLMGVELFGAEHVLYFALACFVAYYFSGHSGIYSSQRKHLAKFNRKIIG